ncbi:MAG TPA: hypothetical protein VKU19_05960 [Bryobacteraceae bacterium]|nr:hypothetical protein [Bryobacteraceae bacterium]
MSVCRRIGNFRCLGLVLCLAHVSGAQDNRRPTEVLALIDRARTLPPEFAADVLLRLSASKLMHQTSWKQELIEEAFASGAHAQLPYRQTVYGLATDSRYNQEVSHNDLEILTLQTRAVDAMLSIDPAKALGLFEQIVPPEIPAARCESPATPDVSAYYETAAKLFDRAFTTPRRKREDDMHFLKLRISEMQSPAHVVPALKMLFAVQLTPAQRQELMASFAVTLDHLSGSDRLYQSTETLLVPAALPEWHETPLFVPALRAYIVRQISGPRCSDSLKLRPDQLPLSAASFNKLASLLDPHAEQYKAITLDEARAASDDGTYAVQFPWHSARAKQVLQALQWLNHGGTGRSFTPSERSSVEWNAHYLETRKLIEGWREDEEESPEDYLFLVSETLSTLASLVPPGPARDNAMGNYRTFLETRYAVTENRNLWFTQVNRMLKAAVHAEDSKERAWILSELSRSTNPIIALYAKIEAL